MIFRGLRQLFVVSGLLTILVLSAQQPIAGTVLRELASSASSDGFSGACATLAQVRGFKLAVCAQVQKKFFQSIPAEKSLAEFSPKDVGSPSQKIDKEIRFVAFQDASGAAALSYCYFVFKGTIDPSKIQPMDLSLASSGFSISSADVGAYANWVASKPEGQRCKVAVEEQTGYALPDAEKEIQGKLALVAVNPLAALNGGFVEMKTLIKEMQLSLNHARVIAHMQRCPVIEAWGQKQWLSMSEEDRKIIRTKLSAYRWDDIQVAGRQYAAFMFENDPNQILTLAKGCE